MSTKSTCAMLGTLAMILSVLVACGETPGPEEESVPGFSTTTASAGKSGPEETALREPGTPVVPAASLDDIARWGSSMLVVSVTGEDARMSSSAAPGEVEVGRDLAVKVEQVVWQHPRAVTTVSAGDRLTIYTFPGFVELDGKRSPAVAEGAVRMDVGLRYVVAMTDDLVNGAQVLTLLNAFVLEEDFIWLHESEPVSLAEAAADLGHLSADEVDAGPRAGESLIQRLERVGHGR